LESCKFLETALLLGREELELHRWIFISESFELYDSESRKIALIDRLSNECQEYNPESSLNLRQRGYLGHSRPLLALRKINSRGDLCHFFTHLSANNYFSLLDFNECRTITIEEILFTDFKDVE
jgi:hypothetical protein